MALDCKMLIYFMPICNILQALGIFYDHLVHSVFILYIFSGFGIIYQEKSGNPETTYTHRAHAPSCRSNWHLGDNLQLHNDDAKIE
jgi:hypothetical protein